MHGVFFSDIEWGEGYVMLDRSLFYESIMTAPHGQVTDIREMVNGRYEFFYGRETTSQHQFQDLKVGILNEVFYTPAEVSELYAVFAKKPGAIPLSVSHLFRVEDEFSGNGIIDAKRIFRV